MASVLKANLIDTCRGNGHLSAPSLLRKMDLVTNLEKKGTETQNGPTIRVFRPPGLASSFSREEAEAQRGNVSRFYQS